MKDKRKNPSSVERPPRSKRLGERGIAIFVVVLVLTILTAVGMFAAHISGLNQRTSGYAKQGTMTGYASQYGVEGAALMLGPEEGSIHLSRMDSNTEVCQANQGVDGSVTCEVINESELQNSLVKTGGNGQLFEPNGQSFGPGGYDAPKRVIMKMELFDKRPARPIAGFQENAGATKQKVVQVAVDSFASVAPQVDGGTEGGACSTPQQQEAMQVGGVRTMRAYVTGLENK